jgi:protein TonB
MSAAVNDRPHEIVPAVHLPLTGELHPLRREFTRWLATGNMITITLAVVVCATIYFWPREAETDGVRIIKDFPSPRDIMPRIDPNAGGGGPPGVISVIPDLANFEPTKDEDLESDPAFNQPSGSEENDDPSFNSGPITDLYGNGPPLEIEPVAPSPDDGFVPFDTPPVFVSITPPTYPNIVKEAGIEGTVMVRVFIGLNGHVKDAYVVEGSSALRDAALTSARTAFFKPARQGNHPVEVWVVIPISFQLHERF